MPDVPVPDKDLIEQAEFHYSMKQYGDFVNDLHMLEVQTKGNIALANAEMEANGIIPKFILSTISDLSITNHDLYVDDNGLFVQGYSSIQGDPANATLEDPYDGYSGHPESSGIKPEDDITPAGINQAQNGDCSFLATMGALANTEEGRQAIMDMITVNPTDYTVKFPGADEEIHVSRTDIATYHLDNTANWANILESAFLEHNGKPDASVDDAIELLTGEPTSDTDYFHALDYDGGFNFTTTPKEEFVADLIANTAADGTMLSPTIASTFDDSPLASVLGIDSGPFVDRHAWTVLAYDHGADLVTIRNPWGNTGLGSLDSTDGSIKDLGDGMIQMSVDSMMKYFAEVQFAS